MPVSHHFITAEEFERMPEEPGIYLELVRGRVIRMVAPGGPHGEVAMRLGGRLVQYVEANDLGIVYSPVGTKLEANPDTVRIPDLCFVRRERVPPKGRPGFVPVPDLAIEVVSPNDRPGMIRSKVAQYLDTGVRLVWVVDPVRETVTAYKPSGEVRILEDGDILEGGDVVPGFGCEIRRIFNR